MKSTLSIDLGMPHLGRNNLSESALFKAIGDDRWRCIQEAGGVPSALIKDDAGARLYATFFFLELHASPEHPLSVHGENERLGFDSDLSHFQKVYLDGRHVLRGARDVWIRSSNVFIYQERGPSKLSMSIPENMRFDAIPELAAQPDSLALCREAKERGCFLAAAPDDVPLFAGEREFVYQIDADRDLNGAGLVYFANFVSFLDLAERRVVAELARPVPPEVMDGRSTYRRMIGYFGNAQSTDRLAIAVRARMRALPGGPTGRLLDLGFDFRVTRSSDAKLIVVSSCRKVCPLEPGSAGEAWHAGVVG